MRKVTVFSALASLAIATPLVAGEISVSKTADGSYEVSGDLNGIGEIAGGKVAASPDTISAFARAMGGQTGVDYSNGIVVNGPVTASIGRDSGGVGYYGIKGRILIFAQPKSYSESVSNYSFRGIIIYKDSKDRLRADSGTISLIK